MAIQTTLQRLKASAAGLEVLPVNYSAFRGEGQRPQTPIELAMRKRQPFAYEKERRIVQMRHPPKEGTLGWYAGLRQPVSFPLTWDPERHLERIVIHPGADASFREAVVAVVAQMAPTLVRRVLWSGMAEQPPD